MGDWTCHLTIYAMPEGAAEAAADVLYERDMAAPAEISDGDPDVAQIGHQYVDDCALVDQAILVGRELAELGCTVLAWCLGEDDTGGTVFMSTPALGEFWANCDADGAVHLTARQLAGATTPDAVDRKLGVPWLHAIQALAASGVR
jgi:hypothetical protein